MENFANIKFDGNLIKNKPCKITYSGFLFENGSTSVTIVYGFNSNWENTDAKEMIKTDNGFCLEINMQDYDSFNFCFRNSNYEWDNNYNKNYTVEIISDDGIVNNSPTETDEENIIDSNTSVNDEVTNDSNEENTNDGNTDDSNCENTNVSNIVADDTSNNIYSFEVDVLNNQAINIEDTLVNTVEEVSLNSDIENLFENIYNSSSKENYQTEENIISENVNTEEFCMDSLIDEILSPIVSSSVFEGDQPNDSQNEVQNGETDENVDVLINDLISNIYSSTLNIETPLDDNKDVNIFSETDSTVQNDENTIAEAEITNYSDEKLYASNKSLTDTINTLSSINDTDSKTNTLAVSSRSLNKFYLWKKKVKVAFCRFFRFMYKEPNSTEI